MALKNQKLFKSTKENDLKKKSKKKIEEVND
jgi:hypothetical protein